METATTSQQQSVAPVKAGVAINRNTTVFLMLLFLKVLFDVIE